MSEAVMESRWAGGARGGDRAIGRLMAEAGKYGMKVASG